MNIFILAAGKATRIDGEIKQLLPIHKDGESIIARIIRQVRNRGHEPTVVTHLVDQFHHLGTPIIIPTDNATTCNTLLSTTYLWDDRTIILLGDVVYARDALNMVFSSRVPFFVLGDKQEIYALSFGARTHMKLKLAARLGAGHRLGKLRYLVRAYYNHDPANESAPILGHLTPPPFGGATMDVDTWEQYRQLYVNTHKRLKE